MDLKNKFDNSITNHAIDKGIAHLLSQTENGRWRGFPTLAGESDIWVTGFVLAHICSLSKQKDVLKEAQNFLLQSIHTSGGWSYSAQVPPDADSTSWCLMALQSSAGFTGLALEKARAFLWSHFTGMGVSTYHVESGIREFISAPDNETIAGWTAAHPDVSIAAILADIQDEKVPAILTWLINRQTTDEGFINSYWWRGPYYTTTLLLRAITKLKQRLPGEQPAMIAGALIRKQLKDGGFSLDPSAGNDPFTTALALESFTHLSYLGHQPERMKCGNALLLSQQENGSWAGDFILRIPAPFVTDPSQVESWNCGNGGGNSFVDDKGGIFATAMACYALDCWRQKETQK